MLASLPITCKALRLEAFVNLGKYVSLEPMVRTFYFREVKLCEKLNPFI